MRGGKHRRGHWCFSMTCAPYFLSRHKHGRNSRTKPVLGFASWREYALPAAPCPSLPHFLTSSLRLRVSSSTHRSIHPSIHRSSPWKRGNTTWHGLSYQPKGATQRRFVVPPTPTHIYTDPASTGKQPPPPHRQPSRGEKSLKGRGASQDSIRPW